MHHLRLIAITLTLGLGVCLSAPLQAEVYKWVDENGKTQFSDKPPANKTAENISQKVEQTNIDENSGNVSRSVDSGEKTNDEIQLEKKRKAEEQRRKGPACNQLRKEIHLIESGHPVSFLDENGNDTKVAEKDRAKKLAEWKAHYAELGCEP